MDLDDDFICSFLGENNSDYFNAIAPPIIMTSLHTFGSMEEYLGYKADNQFIYGRVSNPTVRILEQKIAALERGEDAKVFASGMAAMSSAILSQVQAGDHVICIKNVYGPIRTFITKYLPKYGIEHSFTEGTTEEIEKAIRPNTKLIYLESPSSLVFSLQDLRAVAALAKSKGIITAIDNSLCSPIFQKPIELGIDIVLHTLSKYIGGHADIIGGVLVSSKKITESVSVMERELLGGIIGPMEGWLCIRGLRTLPTRMKVHSQSTIKIAEYLEAHPLVEKVYYPFIKSFPQYELAKKQMKQGSGLLSFTIKDDKDLKKALAFSNALKHFRIGVSWGGFENIAVMPFANNTEEETLYFGGERNLVRLGIGLDSCETILEDIENAFKSCK